MRTVFGLAVLAALALAAPPAPAGDFVDGLAEGKDELAKGEWDGKHTFRQEPSGGASGAAPAPAQNPAPSGGGGTPTPAPEVGGSGSPTTDGGEGTTAGGTTGEPTGTPLPGDGEPATGAPAQDPSGGSGGAPAPGGGGSGNPTPAPAPLPSCTSRWVLEQEMADPALEEKETLLTLMLFRNDAYAFLCNGYARAESTWYVDLFATSTTGHTGMEQYEVVLRLEGECPNCAPRIEVLGTSFLEARAQVKTSWGTICGRSQAKSSCSTVWTGDLVCDGTVEARVSDLLTGSEAKLEAMGVSISSKGTRDFVEEVVTGGSGYKATLLRARTEVRVANKGAVRATAADVENNCQAKIRVGEEMQFLATTSCGAKAEFELELLAR